MKCQGNADRYRHWKQIPQQAAGYYILRFAGLDSSSNNFQHTALLKFGTHSDLQIFSEI
jgi:hypothetical protein